MQVSSRNDIYEHDTTDEEAVKEDAQRMDALMRQMLGGDDEDDETEEDEAEGKTFFFQQKKSCTEKIKR